MIWLGILVLWGALYVRSKVKRKDHEPRLLTAPVPPPADYSRRRQRIVRAVVFGDRHQALQEALRAAGCRGGCEPFCRGGCDPR
jgi:hypothetical protein